MGVSIDNPHTIHLSFSFRFRINPAWSKQARLFCCFSRCVYDVKVIDTIECYAIATLLLFDKTTDAIFRPMDAHPTVSHAKATNILRCLERNKPRCGAGLSISPKLS